MSSHSLDLQGTSRIFNSLEIIDFNFFFLMCSDVYVFLHAKIQITARNCFILSGFSNRRKELIIFFIYKQDKPGTVWMCAKSLPSVLAAAFKIISRDKASHFKNTHPINKYLSKLVWE